MDPITGAITIAGFLTNLSGAMQGQRQQRQAFRDYLNAVRQDQARWDRRYGATEEMLSGFLSGTETAGQQMRRERTERRLGESTFRQVAGGIASDFEAAKASSEAAVAGAGLKSSGAVGTTQARLGEAAITAGAQARQAGIQQGRRSMFDFLALGGQRPSMSRALAQHPALQGTNNFNVDVEPLLLGARSIFRRSAQTPSPYGNRGEAGDNEYNEFDPFRP